MTGPRSARPLRATALAFGICIALALPAPAQAQETLLLDVSVNGQLLEGIVLVERRDDGSLVVPADVWTRARLTPAGPPVALADGRSAYVLQSVPGLQFELDRAALRLSVRAPPTAFASAPQNLGRAARPLAQRPGAGVYLNYDLSATFAGDRRDSRGAAIEAIAFDARGALVAGAAWRALADANEFFRTDTYWRSDFPAGMRSLVIGDTTSSAGGWSRPVRYGGVRFARDFSVAPGYITYPMPSISGSAALPSTIDVLINGRRGTQTQVQPGPFELTNVPVVGGAGEMQLVVRDLLGRETLVTQSYYVAPQLLARGLDDFAYEAGRMREGYGTGEDRYRNAFVAGTYRRGLADWITGEVRVEAERERGAAGLALTAVIGRIGVLGLAAGWSEAEGMRGGHYVVTAQRKGPRGGISLGWSHFDREFREFGARADEPRIRDQFTVSAGTHVGRWLSTGLNLTRRTEWSGETFDIASASVGMQFRGGTFLGFNAGRSVDEQRTWSASINLIVPIGRRRVFAANTTRQADGALVHGVQASQSSPAGTGWGWRVGASDRATQRLRADSVFNGNLGQATAEANLGEAANAFRLGLNGSLGHLAGMSFASRRIEHGAFAVVRVGDVPGVDVSLSHQLVARTNREGLALVTGLLPYQANVLTIDPDRLPLEAEIGGVEATVVPYARSGNRVAFQVKRTRSALLVLLQGDGTPVPAGARVSPGPGLAEFSVARRGEVYVTDLADASRLIAQWSGGRCVAQWRTTPQAAAGIARATLACVPLP